MQECVLASVCVCARASVFELLICVFLFVLQGRLSPLFECCELVGLLVSVELSDVWRKPRVLAGELPRLTKLLLPRRLPSFAKTFNAWECCAKVSSFAFFLASL